MLKKCKAIIDNGDDWRYLRSNCALAKVVYFDKKTKN